MKKNFGLGLGVLSLFVPSFALAAGLVPCGGPGEPLCEFCHFAALIENVYEWLVAVLTVIFAIMIVVSGLRLVSSVGDAATKESAKKMVSNAIIGLLIVLGAWLLIDLGLRIFMNDGNTSLGPWNEIQCVN